MCSCSAFDAAIASCNPYIMPMTCYMVISSLSARVEPCLVDLIICGFWNFF